MKGLPLGLHETTSGFWKRSTGWDERITSYYHGVIMCLSSAKNARLSQRLAGLPERAAVRRAFGSQKPKKCLEISRHFSRQGYASDVRSRQTFPTTPAQLPGDIRSSQQAPPCCRAIVLLGVRDAHILCPFRSNVRQSYASIAAYLSDKSQEGT